jgi:FkbM family methyltransferase
VHSVKEDLVYDIGLHKGEDAAFYLRKGFRVVGVEANPDLVQQTNQRFLGNDRITILNGAIERGTGDVTFFRDKNSVWGTLDSAWAQRNVDLGSSHDTTRVPILNIKEVFEKFGVPHYLKLDIEGRERVVLDVLQELPMRPSLLSMESEKRSFRNLVNDLRKLSKLGYRRFKIVQQWTIPGTTIETADRAGAPFSYTFEPHASGPFGEDLMGQWMGLPKTIARYAVIFLGYKIFGDYGIAFRVRGGRRIYEWLRRRFGPFPGWHDLHAKLRE